MSLYKQIISLITLFLVIMMGTILWFILNYNKDLIENQLNSNAKNTASFLGLSISKNDSFFDTAEMEGMISSVLDNGFYESITVYDVNDQEVVKLDSSMDEETNIPLWFKEQYAINTPELEANIMQGWLNVGVLKIKVHQEYANTQMWKTFISLSEIFIISTLLLLFIIYVFLNSLLKPLKKLSIQAKAIDNNEFIIENELPNTTEFKTVVIAMNKIISKMEVIFNKEAETLRKYNDLYYKDKDTNLGNRNYLLLKLNSYLKNSQGLMFFFAIRNDNALKKKIGFKVYNQFRSYIISLINKKFEVNKDIVFTKLEDGTFAVLLPKEHYEDVKSLIDDLYEDTNSYIKNEKLDEHFDTKISIGIANYVQNNSSRDLLSKADQALSLADDKTKRINYLENDVHHTKQEWIEILQWALKNDGLDFNIQDIMNLEENSVYMKEYFTKLVNVNSASYSSGYFISIIAAMGWMHDFDKHMINKIFEKNINNTNKENNIVVNLSIEFIKNKECVEWLIKELNKNFEKTNTRFYFECVNADILRNYLDVEFFVNKLNKTKHYFAIETFTYDGDNLDYLKRLKPSYIKIAKSYLLGDNNNISDTVLLNITSTIGALLMVKHVETQDELDKLKQKGIKYVQGRYFDNLKKVNNG